MVSGKFVVNGAPKSINVAEIRGVPAKRARSEESIAVYDHMLVSGPLNPIMRQPTLIRLEILFSVLSEAARPPALFRFTLTFVVGGGLLARTGERQLIT